MTACLAGTDMEPFLHFKAQKTVLRSLKVHPKGSWRFSCLDHDRPLTAAHLCSPKDFTFVCPTEIIAFSDRAKEFAAINTQVRCLPLHPDSCQYMHLCVNLLQYTA